MKTLDQKLISLKIKKNMDIELITIATAAEQVEAEFLRNQLEAAGFEVFLADDNIVGAFNLLAPAVGWIKIRVKAEDAEKASAMVEDLRNSEIIHDENFPET